VSDATAVIDVIAALHAAIEAEDMAEIDGLFDPAYYEEGAVDLQMLNAWTKPLAEVHSSRSTRPETRGTRRSPRTGTAS
jgi:hypothetical protein